MTLHLLEILISLLASTEMREKIKKPLIWSGVQFCFLIIIN